MRGIHWLLVVWMSATPALQAQQTQKPEPTAPFLASEKAPITIVREFTYSDWRESAKSSKSSKPPLEYFVLDKSITSTDANTTQILQFFRRHPKPVEAWIFEGAKIGRNPMMPERMLYETWTPETQGPDWKQMFPEAFWVSRENFKRWGTSAGAKARVHSMTQNGMGTMFRGEVTVWISEKTRLPLRVEAPGLVIQFSYPSKPSAPAPIPENFVKAIQQMRAGAGGQMR